MRDLEELTVLVRESMALCGRVAAGLAAGPGYQPPEDPGSLPALPDGGEAR